MPLFYSLFILVSLNPILLWPLAIEIHVFMLLGCLISFLCINRKLAIYPLICASLLFLYRLMLGASFFGAAFFALFVFFILSMERSQLLRAYQYFKNIFTVLVTLGLVFWVSISAGIGEESLRLFYMAPEFFLNPGKADFGVRFPVYPFLTRIEYTNVEQIFFRFQSVFEEPGFLGTICALILAVERFDLRKKLNLLMFVAGAASLSLAFYVLTFIYLSLFLIFKFSIKAFFGVVTILVLIVLLLYNSSVFSIFVGDRLKVVDGSLSGNNRIGDAMSVALEYWFNNSSFFEKLFGLHNFSLDGSASIFQVFLLGGIIAFLLLILIYFFIYIKFGRHIIHKWESFFFVVIFFISAYQRPSIEDPFFVFIFAVGLTVFSTPISLDRSR